MPGPTQRPMRKKRSGRGARLGQHFLTGLWAAKKLAEAIAVLPSETILEIGPGKGALTKELLALAGQATGAHVVAIEKDEALVEQLQKTFAREITDEKLTLVHQDIRDFEPATWNLAPGTYIVAANIPYYITGEIIRKFLTADMQPREMALLVQKEVADRIIARNGKESLLSLSVKAYGAPKIVANVSRGNFSPPPSVDSAILLIENISRSFFADLDEEKFFEVLHTGFGSKRKQLSGNLKKKFGDIALPDVPKNIRAEDVALDQWKKIVQQLF